MLMTVVHESGDERVFMTRFASVVCYFVKAKAGGMDLHVEPGWASYAPEFERNQDGVREAVLQCAATVLGVKPNEVLAQPFDVLKGHVDPPLPEHYRYARRSQNRARASQ